MSGETNHRGVAAPLNMAIFESDKYALLGWDMLDDHKDQLWTLKQYKKYITASYIARLWYCNDIDAIWDWVARWEFCRTACVIPQFVLRYTEVIRFTKGIKTFPHILVATSQWYM